MNEGGWGMWQGLAVIVAEVCILHLFMNLTCKNAATTFPVLTTTCWRCCFF
jgi:hypothetical protein